MLEVGVYVKPLSLPRYGDSSSGRFLSAGLTGVRRNQSQVMRQDPAGDHIEKLQAFHIFDILAVAKVANQSPAPSCLSEILLPNYTENWLDLILLISYECIYTKLRRPPRCSEAGREPPTQRQQQKLCPKLTIRLIPSQGAGHIIKRSSLFLACHS